MNQWKGKRIMTRKPYENLVCTNKKGIMCFGCLDRQSVLNSQFHSSQIPSMATKLSYSLTYFYFIIIYSIREFLGEHLFGYEI